MKGREGSDAAEPKSASAPPAAWLQRLRGLGALAALALVGFGLSRLKLAGGEEPAIIRLQGAEGVILIAIESEDIVIRWLNEAPVCVVMSRVPVDLDASRWLLHVPGHGPQATPPGWTGIQVDRAGTVHPYPLELDRQTGERLRRASFGEARALLSLKDARLAGFWRE